MPYYFHNVPYFWVKLLNNNKLQAGVWFYPLGIYSISFHLKTSLTDVSQQGYSWKQIVAFWWKIRRTYYLVLKETAHPKMKLGHARCMSLCLYQNRFGEI